MICHGSNMQLTLLWSTPTIECHVCTRRLPVETNRRGIPCIPQHEVLLSDIRTWQQRISGECRRRWPDVTVMREFIALVEEIGEVGRCIVKRDEGTRGTPEEWTAQEKVEIGQVMGVLMTVAALEGFDITECLEVAWEKFKAMPDTEGMRLEL